MPNSFFKILLNASLFNSDFKILPPGTKKKFLAGGLILFPTRISLLFKIHNSIDIKGVLVIIFAKSDLYKKFTSTNKISLISFYNYFINLKNNFEEYFIHE